jgi:hypothetical protein
MIKKKIVIVMVLLLASALLPLPGSTSMIAQANEGGFTRIDGEIRGYPYSLFRPNNWNGDLVLLVHGSLPEFYDFHFEKLAPELAAQGFGVGFTSMGQETGSGEGAALKEVTLNTRLVQAQFTAQFEAPNRTYLYGFSRGATNITQLLETSPVHYDGVFSVCGGNGGAQVAWNYFLNARVLFDYYFPAVIPGDPLNSTVSDLDGFFMLVPDIIAAIVTNPNAAIEMAGVDQYALVYSDFNELIGGIVESLAIPITSVNALIHDIGGNPFDNTGTTYTGSSNDAALNAGVARFTADQRATNYLRTWGKPNGSIGGTPYLVLHTSGDSIVHERFHNDYYQSLVQSTGNIDYFLRRVVDRTGHCTFSNEELAAHFSDLVNWVETGVKPSP